MRTLATADKSPGPIPNRNELIRTASVKKISTIGPMIGWIVNARTALSNTNPRAKKYFKEGRSLQVRTLTAHHERGRFAKYAAFWIPDSIGIYLTSQGLRP